MGGLKKYMPITYWTSLIGSLALIGFPGTSGFFSKDAIIEAVHNSDIYGHTFAYIAVLSGVFITAFYSFRMFFLVFHGEERMDDHTREHLHETPWVVTGPLIALAIPSVIIGGFTIGWMLFGDYFNGAIVVHETHDALNMALPAPRFTWQVWVCSQPGLSTSRTHPSPRTHASVLPSSTTFSIASMDSMSSMNGRSVAVAADWVTSCGASVTWY